MSSTNDIEATSSVCDFEPRQKNWTIFNSKRNEIICTTICLEYNFIKYQNKIRCGVICKNTFILKIKHAVEYCFSSPSLLLIYEFKSFFTNVSWLTDMRLFQRKRKCCKLLRSFSVMKFRICSWEMLSATKWETNWKMDISVSLDLI